MDKDYLSKMVVLILCFALFVSCNIKNERRIKQKKVHHQTCATFIEIDSAKYDMGRIRWSGKPIKHLFILKNSSSQRLYINDIVTGCGCITVDYTKKIIFPKDTASVTMKYTPNKRSAFDKSALILLNGGKYYVQISLSGRFY